MPGIELVTAIKRSFWALVLVSALAGCGTGHPSDARLLERFIEHRAELTELVRMFQADRGLVRVGPDFTRPEDPRQVGVSVRRIEEYRRLCGTVDAAGCIEGYGTAHRLKEQIWIHVSTSGLSVSGSSKGYLYCASAPEGLTEVPDLDRVSPRVSDGWVRHIGGPWYLYLDTT